MSNFIRILIEFMISYILVFILYFFIFVFKKTKYNKNKVPVEFYYLISVYKLDQKDINYKKFIYLTAFVNSFIIVFTYMAITILIDSWKWIFKLLIGIVLIILLIIIIYGIIGRCYQKRCKKNV